MKKLVVVAVLCLPLMGCEMLQQHADPDTPVISVDVNDVNAVSTGLAATGEAIQATGTATGQPGLVGLGALLVTAAAVIGKVGPMLAGPKRRK
jgi:hypothetical protein